VHGSGLVERHISKSSKLVSRGGERPFDHDPSLIRWRTSNPRRVGQDFTRAGTLFDRWDVSKVRAATKCFLPGLHEMVVIERSDVLLALGWVQALIRATGRGDATGARKTDSLERAPLPRCEWYYHAHILRCG